MGEGPTVGTPHAQSACSLIPEARSLEAVVRQGVFMTCSASSPSFGRLTWDRQTAVLSTALHACCTCEGLVLPHGRLFLSS